MYKKISTIIIRRACDGEETEGAGDAGVTTGQPGQG